MMGQINRGRLITNMELITGIILITHISLEWARLITNISPEQRAD